MSEATAVENTTCVQPVETNGTANHSPTKTKGKPKAKKTAVKKKTAVAKATPKQKTKAKVATPKPKKEGLTTPFLRTLGIIVKAKGGITRRKVAEATAKKGVACYNNRISNESATYKTLIEGGYVKERKLVDESAGVNEIIYEATAKGKKEMESK